MPLFLAVWRSYYQVMCTWLLLLIRAVSVEVFHL